MAWYKTTIIVVALICGSAWAWVETAQAPVSPSHHQMQINDHTIQVETATTPAQHYQGLSDRLSICSDCGMLFVFPQPVATTFVMRRMHFPLDIIWLKQRHVVGMSRNLPPEQAEPYTPYPSAGEVDMVLELPAGAANRYNLKIGDELFVGE